MATSSNPSRTISTRPDRWPASPLDAVGRAFDLLTLEPSRHTYDGDPYPGLPDGPIPLPRLRRLLLSTSVPAQTRDDVWRDLVLRTRRPAPDGPTWTVLATGLALPGLTRAAALLTRGWQGEAADIDAEVLTGFVARLATLDPQGRRVLGRLLDAAVRAGRAARTRAADIPLVRIDRAWPSAPSQPWGHPDWVLARAVTAGILDRTEAYLIGATRLEDIPLAQAAAALNVDPALAAEWRGKAERALRAAILAGELDEVRIPRRRSPDRPRPARRRPRLVLPPPRAPRPA